METDRRPRSESDARYDKVLFRLERDEHGYPPEDIESMWAREVGQDLYALDNIPFYAPLVSWGDVVRVRREHGALYFDRVVLRSGHSTVRLLLEEPDSMEVVRNQLRELGCGSERGISERLIAVDIPPDVRVPRIQKFLVLGAERGLFDYEESSLYEP